MERNLGAAYQLYLNSVNNSPLTSFDEWLKQNYYFTNTQKVNLASSSSLQTAVSSPTYFAIPVTVETRETQENTSTQAGTNELSAPEKKKRERWSESQTKTLVYLWKEHFRDLQTSKQHLIWIKIKTAVNEKGREKTLKQLKDKIRNLKDAYKAARDNNKKTGASPTYSPYFEEFDEVLGTPDVINTPFVGEVRVLNQDVISDDGGKGNLILFRIYFSEGRERCSELKERCLELKGVYRKVFAKPVLVNNLYEKLWSNFLK